MQHPNDDPRVATTMQGVDEGQRRRASRGAALGPCRPRRPDGIVTTFKVGDRVKTAETVKPARLATRTGCVVEVNKRDNEVGVKFGAASRRDEVTTWFRPSELEPGSSLYARSCASIAPGTGFPAAKAS
jgi:hypothetical protein